MFSMPLPGGQASKPPLRFLSLSKSQNDLAYGALEKSRLGRVEEVGKV